MPIIELKEFIWDQRNCNSWSTDSGISQKYIPPTASLQERDSGLCGKNAGRWDKCIKEVIGTRWGTVRFVLYKLAWDSVIRKKARFVLYCLVSIWGIGKVQVHQPLYTGYSHPCSFHGRLVARSSLEDPENKMHRAVSGKWLLSSILIWFHSCHLPHSHYYYHHMSEMLQGAKCNSKMK